jgi:hypothetical protein
MAKLILNPATKRQLKEAPDKALFLRDYLIKNYTVSTMTDIIADYYLDESVNIPKVKLSKDQLEKFFEVK